MGFGKKHNLVWDEENLESLDGKKGFYLAKGGKGKYPIGLQEPSKGGGPVFRGGGTKNGRLRKLLELVKKKKRMRSKIHKRERFGV